MSLLIEDSANSSFPLSWNTPLSELMREDFVLSDDYVTLHATVEDALSHRTGLAGHDFSIFSANLSVRQVVRRMRYLPLTAEIRTRWQYCNMMFIAISHAIEIWTGMWLGDFLKTRIYEPLNLTSTFFSLKDAQRSESNGGPSLATGYFFDNYTQKHVPFPWIEAPQVSGAGNTISNVLDYSKWLRCHLTAAPPLSSNGHKELHSPRMIADGFSDADDGFRGPSTYGLGWQVNNYRGETLIYHGGGLPGFTTTMMFFPRLQWGLTTMANGGDASGQLSLVFRMIDDMMGVPAEERFPWEAAFTLRNQRIIEVLSNAKEILYPSAPKGKDVVPLSLPLEFYSGVSMS